MRMPIAIGGMLAALLLGSAPALAFQETPPPPDKIEAPVKSKTPAPMQLGSPAIPGEPAADPEAKGGLFGFGLLPKLNFGLELMYGKDQEQAETKPAETTEEKSELGVLGRIKRLF